MRFSIKIVGGGGERIGCLADFVKSSSAVVETPSSALLTQGGSVVNLTADVLLRVFSNPQLLWVPLSNSMQLEAGVKAQGEGVAKFAGLQGHVTCAALHNINEKIPPGHFEQDRVPLWTKNGKKMITADRYMDIMDIFKPDIILAIADDRLSLSEGFKRMNKSVDRTCNMLETCVRRYKASKHIQSSSLIGVIVGVGHDKSCNDCIQHILKHKENLAGVALAGITDGTEQSYNVPLQKLQEMFKKIGEALPKDLLRIVEGCWNPAVVVAAIEHGWDIFDGSYPIKLTNTGHALSLNFDVNRNSDELCILDLNDKRYHEDFAPILKDCECLACKKHTRAYIRHLLNTREMLAHVLLSIHNLHHFDQMFLHARGHIAANTFQVYKNHVTKQYELYQMSQTTNGTNEETGKVGIDMKEKPSGSKKIRVSNEVTVNDNVVIEN